jgi:hypothetical protein
MIENLKGNYQGFSQGGFYGRAEIRVNMSNMWDEVRGAVVSRYPTRRLCVPHVPDLRLPALKSSRATDAATGCT